MALNEDEQAELHQELCGVRDQMMDLAFTLDCMLDKVKDTLSNYFDEMK